MMPALTPKEFEQTHRASERFKLDRILENQARIEAKLDALLDALAYEQEEDEEPAVDLDGNPAGGERDPNQPL